MKHGESGVLQIVDMTGEKLLRTLEYAIPADNDIRGWFYYFSGLKMTYAPSAMPGKRIIKITDAEGKPLEATSGSILPRSWIRPFLKMRSNP